MILKTFNEICRWVFNFFGLPVGILYLAHGYSIESTFFIAFGVFLLLLWNFIHGRIITTAALLGVLHANIFVVREVGPWSEGQETGRTSEGRDFDKKS
jgi:hypothetical protein